ncbi:hypothetical protein G6F50_015888 [Rhizopus delemar]|uniref:Uncharacterized protein n=1 Tax=Rhizopus delemar TaxID=936053 RepID=A0A9P6XVE2_9FUNG|nr:hypothetical protein G6F50_015888 [Rhizopus delemar]
MRSLRVMIAPSTEASRSVICCGDQAVTVSVTRSCTRSRSGAMAASISGWLTHTVGRVSAIDLPGDARGDRADIATLRTMAQRLVHQHHRHHRLGDRGGTDADAGIVPAQRLHHDRFVRSIDRTALNANAGRRFDRQGHGDRLTR